MNRTYWDPLNELERPRANGVDMFPLLLLLLFYGYCIPKYSPILL